MSGKETDKALSGGELLAAISKMIVSIMRERYGRGPIKAKTYVLDDLVVVVLRNGFIEIEETMMRDGRKDDVVEMRHGFQGMVGDQYKQEVEKLTGRRVVAFLSQAHIEPDITLEVFFMDGPLKGFGALEIVDPDADDVTD